MLEFLVVFPILLALILATIEGSRALVVHLQLSSIAEEAARAAASVPGIGKHKSASEVEQEIEQRCISSFEDSVPDTSERCGLAIALDRIEQLLAAYAISTVSLPIQKKAFSSTEGDAVVVELSTHYRSPLMLFDGMRLSASSSVPYLHFAQGEADGERW